ncbi:hypothetical protein Glove_363g10 [Diversispora epigaea]|uniref:Uncharacterized protein n=1 Tax=Diversispora epigaea TaxID=1348612 RepID=A0A397H963_9GLOM|nr:hypothetical protein Glove_363g10 [Diversispora epigaea]
MGNVFQANIKIEILNYYGAVQKVISKYPIGLQLEIPDYDYGFAIEVQGQQHEKYIEFFDRGDPNNFKELYPYIVIPEHLRELGLIE